MLDARTTVVIGTLLVLALGGCEVEEAPADQEAGAIIRPVKLEDPDDIHRRAVIAIDRRIEEFPEDAEHREELIAWKEQQLLLDDMQESMEIDEDYGFGKDDDR